MASPPPELDRFLELVNAGEYWASHEELEPAWHRTRSEFLHGLILLASAWVHWERSNPVGVVAQARKAAAALALYPSDYLGLDVRRLRAACEQLIRGDGIAPSTLALEADRIRGDEPELDGPRAP